jgi:RHS repeat-associated protein
LSRYVYAGFQRIADYNGSSGALQNRYVYGSSLDEPLIAVSSSGTLTYLHADKSGSIVATTNSSGAVLNKDSYSPFGESATFAGSTFGFTGQRYDSETGLYYYKARYYSPSIGRFLQPDPIGYTKLPCTCRCKEIDCDGTGALQLNLYSYVGNDPLNWSDPLGLAQSANSGGYFEDPGRINCAGYACGIGHEVTPGDEQSLSTFFTSLGANCTGPQTVHNPNCVCDDPADYPFLVVVYKSPHDDPKLDPWTGRVGKDQPYFHVISTYGSPTEIYGSIPLTTALPSPAVGVGSYDNGHYDWYCCCTCKPPYAPPAGDPPGASTVA